MQCAVPNFTVTEQPTNHSMYTLKKEFKFVIASLITTSQRKGFHKVSALDRKRKSIYGKTIQDIPLFVHQRNDVGSGLATLSPLPERFPHTNGTLKRPNYVQTGKRTLMT